jgi:hypothetical protein
MTKKIFPLTRKKNKTKFLSPIIPKEKCKHDFIKIHLGNGNYICGNKLCGKPLKSVKKI